MSEVLSVGAAGKVLGWLSRGARWINRWLARFRAEIIIESCDGGYREGQGPQRDMLQIGYILQLVNREATPNSVHAITFRFRHREVGSTEVPDLGFSGLNIGPRATETYLGQLQLSESFLQYGAGQFRSLGGDVIITLADGKTAEGTFNLWSPEELAAAPSQPEGLLMAGQPSRRGEDD